MLACNESGGQPSAPQYLARAAQQGGGTAACSSAATLAPCPQQAVTTYRWRSSLMLVLATERFTGSTRAGSARAVGIGVAAVRAGRAGRAPGSAAGSRSAGCAGAGGRRHRAGAGTGCQLRGYAAGVEGLARQRCACAVSGFRVWRSLVGNSTLRVSALGPATALTAAAGRLRQGAVVLLAQPQHVKGSEAASHL